MPPKPKFTKEEIALTALQIIKEEGVAALTARNLGARLGVSARPIFTAYQNMDDVKQSAKMIAMKEFETYASDFAGYTPAFKRVGMLMISYAVNEPEMFKLLFMQEHKEKRSFEDTMSDLGNMANVCVQLIKTDYQLTEDEAKTLFQQMWVHAYGLGVMCAMKVCDFSEEEIAEMLGQVFAGFIMMLRSGKKDMCSLQPSRDFKGTINDLPYLR